jgi:hypothetical protein
MMKGSHILILCVLAHEPLYIILIPNSPSVPYELDAHIVAVILVMRAAVTSPALRNTLLRHPAILLEDREQILLGINFSHPVGFKGEMA